MMQGVADGKKSATVQILEEWRKKTRGSEGMKEVIWGWADMGCERKG